ncbi:hypothetical protein ACH5RR_027429 [Cinchona calisaya]|uniref:Uncharacterized protein n=1 Tax=Cinchona calisaya TaxID=153742 RepID=A0ABD2Z9B7_9GENT
MSRVVLAVNLDTDNIALRMLTLDVEMSYLLLRPDDFILCYLVERQPIFRTDVLSSDDLESFMSSLPSSKDIYNSFNNDVFVKGSGFLQMKRTKKGKEIFHLEDETNDELFDYTLLNDGTPDSVTTQQGENQQLEYEACLEATHSQLESLTEEHGKLVQDISSMKNSLNVLDGEINKLETNLSLLQTRRAAEAQTLTSMTPH